MTSVYNTREYSGVGVGSPCQFTTLGHYYPYKPGNMQPAPVNNAMLTSNYYAVPNYTQLQGNYNALVSPHGGGPSCNGFMNVMAAYGTQPCPYKFMLSDCSGGGMGPRQALTPTPTGPSM